VANIIPNLVSDKPRAALAITANMKIPRRTNEPQHVKRHNAACAPSGRESDNGRDVNVNVNVKIW